MASLDAPFAELQAEIAKLKTALAQLEKSADDLTGPIARGEDKDIARLGPRITQLRNAVTAFQSDLGRVTAEISALTGF